MSRNRLPRLRRLATLALAALLAGSCAGVNLSNVQADEILADIGEFLGASDPGRHVQKLVDLHDAATFRHRPDVPPTYDDCLDEIRILAESDYGTWREVAMATFFVTRVAVDDQAVVNRVEAVEALARLGEMVFDAEDRGTGDRADEREVTEAIGRLRDIHDPAGAHVPDDPATAAECARLLAVVGDLQLDRPPNWSDAELRFRLRSLRGILKVIVSTNLSREARSEAGQAGVDRTVIRIAAQATRLSLMDALVADSETPVRAAAADVLGRLGAGAATVVPGLREALGRERSAPVRREIVQSLGELAMAGGAEARDGAVPLLLASLEDDDLNVRYGARTALSALAGRDLGEEAGPWLEWWAGARSGR